MLEELEHYFATTSPEQIKIDWEKSAKWDKIGPTCEEFINTQKHYHDLQNLSRKDISEDSN